MSFAPLHVHTEYSMLDAMNKIKDYVKRCKELGINSAAITDHGVMYGVIDFYHACENVGIKPILGCEVYVAPCSRLEKDTHNRYNHLILLAENNEGYYNLSQICSEGFGDGYYYKPRVDDEILQKYHKGIICLSACLAGRVQSYLIKNDYERAKEEALRYRDIFGIDNYFLELQDHKLPEDADVIQGLLRIHNETGIPLVATNDTHYTKKEDMEAHDMLLCIQQEKFFDDNTRMRDTNGQYYLKSEEEMRELFKYIPEAIDNTQKIADRCNVTIKFHETKMPQYPTGELTAWEYLNKLADEGFMKRYKDYSEEDRIDIRKQLTYQLSVIKQMGYVEYFLIVWDYCNWCRDNGIPVGPGRGSAAGSYVTYCIGITNIEPRQFTLQFERFLNPERVSMPDIDVDFCMRRRPEVIEHVKEVYGKDNVVQIITFGTMAAKSVLKTVGKYLGYPYAFCNNLAGFIPKEVGMNLTKAVEQNIEFKEYLEKDTDAKRIFDISLKLEGLPKSTGTHAAGVIVSDRPVKKYIPLARTADGTGIVSQFTMTAVEELGLLKMDFLGLRTLTAEDDAIKNIKENFGKDIDLDHINLADKNVYDFISQGNTDGVFQLESAGMQDFMKKLKPSCIEDMIAGVSLYRPGPMDYIPTYIEGKQNQESVVYDCPQLEPILKPTYGCIVYQEQVTQIVRDLAGYSMGAADNIRRAMSKKKQYVIDAEREIFVNGNEEKGIEGAIKHVGISAEVANRIYDHMVDFAKYAFNKSHAACYAVICYQTAWLMTYYKTEYWAATMTSVIENADKLTAYIQSVKAAGIILKAPDINKSTNVFIAEKNGDILYALCGIKGISEDIASIIVKDRNEYGLYKDFANALDRLSLIGVDKSGIGNLILTGAFDSFDGNRNQKYSIYEKYLANIKKESKTSIPGQMSLFDMADMGNISKIDFPDIANFSSDMKLENEKEASGVYISGHPLDSKKAYINKYSNVKTTDFISDSDDPANISLSDGQKVDIVAIVTRFSKKFTKKNDVMAFISIEDLYGSIDGVIFPKTYEKCKNIIGEDVKVLIKGHASVSDDKTASIIVDEIMLLDSIPVTIWIQFCSKSDYENKKDVLDSYVKSGKDSVIIYLKDVKQKCIRKSCIDINDSIYAKMDAEFGKSNVAIKI